MTPPIKIALVGAPGSGKSKIARRVARRLNNETKSWVVIDGYVERLAEKTGWTFGEVFHRFAFPLNVQVIAERWRLEDEATKKGMNVITCGSIYESIIYGAAQSIPIQHLDDEGWMLDETFIADVMASSFATLAEIRHDYAQLLYLPLDEESHDWNGVVNGKLDEVLSGCNVTAIVLEGTDRKKVDNATAIITAIQQEAAAQDDRNADRPTFEAGEEQEHRPDEVPDVSEAEEGTARG